MKRDESCGTCRERMEADNVVSIEPPRRPDPSRLREFAETARRLRNERAAAADVVRSLLRNVPLAELASREELRNSGALERLGEESRDLLEKRPQEALAIAELATTIADSLPDDGYPKVVLAQLRAAAWKDRANALRYVSRIDDAWDAIVCAEKTLKSHSALAVDRAVVNLVKALVLWELNEPAEAHRLLNAAERVFASCGDTKNLCYARLIDASVLYKEGRYREAADAYMALLGHVAGDAEMLARLHNNLGYCATQLGQLVDANIHFSEAIARFADLGFRVEAIRTQRGAGQLLVEKGQIGSGLAHLRAARSAFVEVGMVRDAGLCGLRIVEAHLAAGDRASAREMTQTIARDFGAAQFNTDIIEVLAGLDRAIAAEDASVDSIRGVHAFIAAYGESALGAPVSQARLQREH